MARIGGINIPQNKVVHVGLTYIYGIGKNFSENICAKLHISRNKRVNALPDDEVKRNYQRNKKLIDLSQSPDEIYTACLKEFHGAPEGDRSKLLNYFIEKRLRNLTDSIGEF